MHSNSLSILLVICYILVFSTVVVNAMLQRNYKKMSKYEETTLRHDEGWWTPGREVKRMRVRGKNIIFRVVNGKQVRLGEVPYQVSLRKQVRKSVWFANYCGATILTPMELLSATHCFRSFNVFDSCCGNSGRADERMYKNVWAVAGALQSMTHFHGYNDTDSYGQWRAIRTVRYHTSYSFPKNDIAIIFLTRAFIFSDYVKPIPFATQYEDYRGTCVVSGYGRTADGHRSSHLLKADLRMLSAKTCDRIQKRDMSRLICTSDQVSDSGKGDSGGPLVCKNTRDPMETNPSIGIIVGIVSGKKIGFLDGTFFTRVSSFKEFIEQTIKDGAALSKLSVPCVLLVILLQCILSLN